MNESPRERAAAAFTQAFGRTPELSVRAPGRVNLIGEHTDYNDGFVLPCAIDYETGVAASARSDGRLRVVAADFGGAIDDFALDAIAHRPDAPWADYVRGVADVLQRQGLALRGADLAIAGNVPQGAGLSSSAALEVAVLQALNALHRLGLDADTVALLAQRAENEFVGCRCGIMDQLISARAVAGHALLIDCRTLAARPVPLPPRLAVAIVHSRVQRGLVDSAYNERRAQCEAAARAAGVPALRDLDLPTLQAHRGAMDALAFKRARHVVTESQRTLRAADALAAGDLRLLGELMAASHASMRDDFEASVPAIDRLVQIAQQAIGNDGGARITGGGFGGCVVALLPLERAQHLRARIEAEYRAPGGEAATMWLCQARAGAG